MCFCTLSIRAPFCSNCNRAMFQRIMELTAERDEATKLLERSSISIGSFVSDEGWNQKDMDTMDSIDAYLFRLKSERIEK